MAKWFVCCGMRRAAGTWQYYVTRDLLGGNAIDLGWVTHQSFDALYTRCSHASVVLKTHPYLPEHSKLASKILVSGDMYPIYIYRDIRDVVASMKRMRGGAHPKVIMDDVPDILRVDRLWRSSRNVHVSRYETVIDDYGAEIARIVKYVGSEANALQVVDLLSKWSLAQNAARSTLGWSRDNLFWPNHVDGGTVGRWKEELSDEEKGTVHEIAGEWLKENGYV